MNILNYFYNTMQKINNINSFISNPINHKDINNPFASILPKTYVWIEEENNIS